MTNLDIRTDNGRYYFAPFDRYTDHRFSDGLDGYPFAWLGWLLSWLGWSIALTGKNGQIHYLKKDLVDEWISLHGGKNEGDYHERIAEICKSQVVENRKNFLLPRCKATLSQLRSNHLKERKEKWMREFVAILKEKIQDKSEQITQLADEQRKNQTFKITFGNQTIIANEERMRSSHYFRNFLDFKENRSRQVTVHLDEFAVAGNIEIDSDILEILITYLEGKPEKKPEPVVKPKVTEVLPPTTSVPKSGKPKGNILDDDILDDSQLEEEDLLPPADVPPEVLIDDKVEDPKLESAEQLDGEKEIGHLITPQNFEGLLKFHLLLDISGIMEIAYRKIDFYAQNDLVWDGRFVKPSEFWQSLANKYYDRRLRQLCQEKYEGKKLIDEALAKHDRDCTMPGYYANASCRFESGNHADGSLNLRIKFHYDSDYVNTGCPENFYEKRLVFWSKFPKETLKKGKITTLTVNFTKLMEEISYNYSHVNASNYFLNLLRALDKWVDIPHKQCELILEGFSNSVIDELPINEYTFKEVLTNLTKKFSKVTFKNLSIQSIYQKTSYSSEKLFDLFKIEHASLETTFSYSHTSTPFLFSAQLEEAVSPSKKIAIHVDPRSDVNLNAFGWVKNPIEMTLRQTSSQKVWLGRFLLHVSKLTVENCFLNQTFIQFIKGMQHHLTTLTLNECEIAADSQQPLKAIMTNLEKKDRLFNRFAEAVKRNTDYCLSYYFSEKDHSAETCLPEIAMKEDDSSHLILKFKRDRLYAMDFNPDHYAKRFAFMVEHLTEDEIKELNLSSLVLDFNGIKLQKDFDIHIGNYIASLIRDVDQYLIFHNRTKLPIVLQGLPDTFLEVILDEKPLSLPFQALIGNITEILYHHPSLRFQGCKIPYYPDVNYLKGFMEGTEHSLKTSYDDQHLTLELKKR